MSSLLSELRDLQEGFGVSSLPTVVIIMLVDRVDEESSHVMIACHLLANDAIP